ncbi:MAG: ATP-binding protein [Ferruginibacter sp.]
MVIEFTVGNFRSIKDKKALSFEATSLKDYPENIIETAGYKLLKSIVIYGANSSGKSNFLFAIEKMKQIINDSFSLSSTDKIDITPFLLNSETQSKPSYFEILFLINSNRYRYGFEISTELIHSEWLFVSESKTKSEKMLFLRDNDNIDVGKDFKEGVGVEERTKSNTLFLTVTNQFNGQISSEIIEWFSDLQIFSGLEHNKKKQLTSLFLTDKTLRTSIKGFLNELSLGFNDLKIEDKKNIFESIVKTIHNKFDKNGHPIGNTEFDLSSQESSGTNKIYDIAGSITLSLMFGHFLCIDELDAKLHPLLTKAIVQLFHNNETNSNNAQLIFSTHDTNLLNACLFRRDQIYFTEKNKLEETDLYSLSEYKDADGKKARNDSSIEKNYIEGRYGAIPYLGNFSKLLFNGPETEN